MKAFLRERERGNGASALPYSTLISVVPLRRAFIDKFLNVVMQVAYNEHSA